MHTAFVTASLAFWSIFDNPKMLHFFLSLLFICFRFILDLSVSDFRGGLSIMWTCKVLCLLLISLPSLLLFLLFHFNRYRPIIKTTIKKSIYYSHSPITAYCHQNIITVCVSCRLFQRNDINNLYTYYQAQSQGWKHNQHYQVAMSWWMLLVESSSFIRKHFSASAQPKRLLTGLMKSSSV